MVHVELVNVSEDTQFWLTMLSYYCWTSARIFYVFQKRDRDVSYFMMAGDTLVLLTKLV